MLDIMSPCGSDLVLCSSVQSGEGVPYACSMVWEMPFFSSLVKSVLYVFAAQCGEYLLSQVSIHLFGGGA